MSVWLLKAGNLRNVHVIVILMHNLPSVDSITSQVEQNPFLGFMAIAVAVLCSGFAGILSLTILYP